MTTERQQEAKRIRESASQLASDRPHPIHQSNGDEERFANLNFAMNFTKGLEHNEDNGLIENAADFKAFRAAIDKGFVDDFTTSVPTATNKARAWEAPTAGLVYDLQGPDSQAVTMAPAPALGSKELAYEMAEVYELALLREVPFKEFTGKPANPDLADSIKRLNKIDYDVTGAGGRARKNTDGKVDGQTAFRGSSPGVEVGPYLSQLMLLGNRGVAADRKVVEGLISYGPQEISQQVPVALPGVDFMTEWNDWLAVQNGADTQDGQQEELFGPSPVARRFITTPRDLATYVHYDALYQAYLNACLILLGMRTPLDPGFDNLSGSGDLYANGQLLDREAGGFALWGGPHVLTLVTEVATRALKAVRYQKFNVHCRLRPEALAGRIEKASQIESDFPKIGGDFLDLEYAIQPTVDAIKKHNASGTKLLPMAFQEGSPMHPAYGAGHATVAGACVTMLKAFFDTSAVLVKRGKEIQFATYQPDDAAIAYVPDAKGKKLDPLKGGEFLTLEGELNKLAANISIGRNMAGVHYYSDYFDSVRMGEAIAIGMLEEQALCYPTDKFVLSVPTFDGEVRRIGRR